MRVEFTARRDERYCKRLLRGRLYSDSGWGIYLPWVLVLALVLCFAARDRTAFVAGVAVLVALVMLGEGYLFPVRRAMKRLPSWASDPRRIVCDDTGVTVESDLVTTRSAWARFTRAPDPVRVPGVLHPGPVSRPSPGVPDGRAGRATR
ncbi:hypothetical protein Athai_63580 [Actinocatenispora thailandica]|uniref:Uncharacterized protein n=1 Tax=Actinocatenispora thailandica TaxID=227318 RepID=A0A7R7DWF5_9ACTN|nr:hypothetical protein Athai_63580 [Actinocatenispora thailandica]